LDVFEKLEILAGSAKYDASCASSGVTRPNGSSNGVGSAVGCGICHSFAADGRCISLLKVLMTNHCIFDCRYCVNRVSNDTQRATLTPRELADLTINFYRRNYIEGLFLSSGIIRNPNYTSELLIQTLDILRNEYRFWGYIHVKAIPGADDELIKKLGFLADRISANIELPSQKSLSLLAPNKTKKSVLKPMEVIKSTIQENSYDIVTYKNARRFAQGGQSTQMIVGATEDTDHQILKLTEGLYQKYKLKRVYFSAYMPVMEHSLLPAIDTKPPLLREHRLYQADWLLRFYGFKASDIINEQNPNLNLLVDPKSNWALNHIELFPIEVNRASYEMLLRVPGIGVNGAKRIVIARKTGKIDFVGLKKMGIVLKRAQYFVTCGGKLMDGLKITPEATLRAVMSDKTLEMIGQNNYEQLSLFNEYKIKREDLFLCSTNQM
jgi:putative DNA modification/repair radical SAM protein